jgi:antitoxin component HigA of HigAB toxin-antitoxin module
MPTAVAVTHLLRNEKEYTRAVAEIDEILAKNPREGSAADDRLELLSVLVKDYEDRTLPPVEAPSPQAVVDFMLEQKGMKRTDLAEHMGGRGRVSDFFTGARPQLSTNQIRRLRALLGIPADLLLPAE